jgi:DNA-binding transcriptional regulator YhcF (GntR family)
VRRSAARFGLGSPTRERASHYRSTANPVLRVAHSCQSDSCVFGENLWRESLLDALLRGLDVYYSRLQRAQYVCINSFDTVHGERYTCCMVRTVADGSGVDAVVMCLARQILTRGVVDVAADHKPGYLPSVRSLADALACSPGTVQRALAVLQSAGLIVNHGRKGRAVASNLSRSRPKLAVNKLEAMCVALQAHGYTRGDLRAALKEVAGRLT